MPRRGPLKSSRNQHFCHTCGAGFELECNLERHISRSQDVAHKAHRNLVRRGLLPIARCPLPAPDVEYDEDVGPFFALDPMNVDYSEWLGIDTLALGDADGAVTEQDAAARYNTHAAAVDAADASEPVRDVYESAGQPVRHGEPPHAAFERARTASGQKFYPFASEVDYDFAQWLVTESISNAAFERLMKKDSVRTKLGLSYTTSYSLKKIIAKIPCHAPWLRTTISVHGVKQKFELLYRDSRRVVEDLWSRFNLLGKIALKPERRYTDASRTVRMYSSFNTGNWMWRTQTQLRPGATCVPITMFQDKTQLSQLIAAASNIAYPMYTTISTIDSDILRDVSARAYSMNALLPVVNLKGSGLPKSRQRLIGQRVVHKAMRHVLAPLREASHTGMELKSANGVVHDGHTSLAVAALDYPEQCLHAACRGCPKCQTRKEDFGKNSCAPLRTPEETLRRLREASKLTSAVEIERYLKNHGLNYILEPFWKDWAHVDIHEATAPDILHQLYQGLIKHLTAWCRAILGDDELDARISRMPPAYGLRSFGDGISCLQRVSGTEHRAIAKVLLCAMASADVDNRVIRAMAALLDFTYMVQFECQSDETLDDAKEVLDRFHAHKEVFRELGACESFDFPKMHGLQHYVPSIKLFGSLTTISTDIGERLHITECKNMYKASNKKKGQFPKQICTRLTTVDRMDWLAHYQAHVENTEHDARKRRDVRQHEPVEFAQRPAALRTFNELSHLHHAPGLDDALKIFLSDYIDDEWSDPDAQHRGRAPTVPFISAFDRLPVWHNMKFYTPDLQTLAAKDTRDVAYAIPRRLRANLDPEDDDGLLEGRFSPVFVMEGGELAGEGGTDGLRVGRLRVIFELPPVVSAYLEEAGIPPPDKLAFVEWYTPLGRRDRISGMFKVSPDMALARGQGAERVRAVSVIEAADIRRSAYLAPRLDRDTPTIPRELTAENILDEWKGEFWVDHHFDNFCKNGFALEQL